MAPRLRQGKTTKKMIENIREKILPEAIDRSEDTRKKLDYALTAIADWDNGFIEGFVQGVEYAHNAHKGDRDIK